MLTDEHERRASRLDKQHSRAQHASARSPRSPGHSGAGGRAEPPPSAAHMLPGSLRGSAEDGGDGEPQQQPQQQPQRRSSKQGSFNMHTVHGVKSGAWGMLSQNVEMSFDEQQ